jgi:hypothetical protein
MTCGALRVVSICMLALAAVPAWAETPERPKTYALVSAVGDDISIVRARRTTGTHFEGYVRSTMPALNGVIHLAMLRGMDRGIARREPQSTRVFLRLSSGQLDDAPVHQREQAALDRLRNALQALPQRKDWDEIIVITPHYRFSEMQGLPGKLHGVGIYFNNLGNEAEAFFTQTFGPGGAPIENAVVGVDGTPTGRSSRYVALFSYTKVWFLDAKTLQVNQSEPWIVDEKLYDPMSTALDVGKMFTPEQLVRSFESFVERSATRSVVSTRPVVEPGDLQIVEPARSPRAPAPEPAVR